MNKNTAENEALLELVGLAKKDKEDGRVASSSEFKCKLADRKAKLKALISANLEPNQSPVKRAINNKD